jgi:hypothetical protein
MLRLRAEIPDAAIHWLGSFLWVLALVYLYFTIVEELTATYAGPRMDRHVAHEIVTGRYAASFWVYIGSMFLGFAIPFLQYLRGKPSVTGIAIAAALVNVGALVKRLLIVVPSQTHGAFLAQDAGTYAPSWIEWSVMAGAASLVLLIILVFARVFPLAHGHQAELTRDAPLPREPLRKLACITWAALAAVLVGVGLTDSFRLWSGDEFDPRLPYAPTLFALGVMMLFTTAILYEVLPSPRRPRLPRVVDRARARAGPRGALRHPIRATERPTRSSP